ncbi:MAG: hydrogenase maturation nickel metallochaperone HypA [Nitrospiraceae bacterium]|nr:hydrogenase maturation nickel metallochaperone HypA [Nitrospiraceae bacterium]
MHEASIMQSVFEIALGKLEGSGYERVDSISLRIGRATGVVSDALKFAFEALKPGTPFYGAALVIDEVPVGGVCLSCGEDFSTDERFVFQCPACAGSRLDITRGRELDLTGMEVS